MQATETGGALPNTSLALSPPPHKDDRPLESKMNQLEMSTGSESAGRSARSLGYFRLETAVGVDGTENAGEDNNECASPPVAASRALKIPSAAPECTFPGENDQQPKMHESQGSDHRTLLLPMAPELSKDVMWLHFEHTNTDNNHGVGENDGGNNQCGTVDGTSPRRRGSFPCEPMVKYDVLGSVGKADASRVSHLTMGDDDVVNFRSPVARKSAVGSSDPYSDRMAPVELAPRAQELDVDVLDEPYWTDGEFWQYCELLDFLQQACGNAESPDVAISGERLGQMERMLCSLLPPQMQQ